MLRRLVLLATLALLAFPALGRAAVPDGWLGMMADGELLEQPKLLEPELARMGSAGVTTIRAVLRWDAVVRCKTCKPDWRRFDRIVLAAARHGISVLPVLLSAPKDLARNPGDSTQVPKDPADLGDFAKLAVERYGAAGTLWAANPEVDPVPVETWQIWNEPDHPEYLPRTKDWATEYTALLGAASTAIRAADPEAKIMLAGFSGRSWIALDWLYRHDAASSFDEVAVHPYTKNVDDVLRVVRNVRQTQRTWKDLDTPVVLTEVGWTGARGHLRTVPSWCTFCLTDTGAADSLGRLLPMLWNQRTQLNLTGVYYYTWVTAYRQRSAFDYAGLRMYRDGRVVSMPAYFTFLKALARLR